MSDDKPLHPITKALIKKLAKQQAMEDCYEEMLRRQEQRKKTICQKISSFFRYLCR